MITQYEAEKFLKSKLALFMLMLAIIGTQQKWLTDDKITIAGKDKTIRDNDSIHRVELARKDEILYNVQEQQKIKDYNTAQFLMQQNERERARLDRLIYVERRARELKIIK